VVSSTVAPFMMPLVLRASIIAAISVVEPEVYPMLGGA
jgi:hypothetical protein